MPSLLIATGNPHKLEELRALCAPLGITALGLDDVAPPGGLPEPEEDGLTFEQNAWKKAVVYARMTGAACLADDSGLEVDALGGEPGVDSAYYAGKQGDRAARDQRNIEKLLREMKDIPEGKRAARFVCCMCAASPDGSVLATSRGEFPGTIALAPRGTNGFGYDPLLLLEDGRTSAELSPDEKNARSHRAAALRAILPKLKEMLK